MIFNPGTMAQTIYFKRSRRGMSKKALPPPPVGTVSLCNLPNPLICRYLRSKRAAQSHSASDTAWDILDGERLRVRHADRPGHFSQPSKTRDQVVNMRMMASAHRHLLSIRQQDREIS
jgi:hypothetical protein